MRRSFSEWVFDHLEDWFLPGLVILAALVLLFGLPAMVIGVYHEFKRPEFGLKKHEWICTRARKEASVMYVKSGNAFAPVTPTISIYDQWTRR